MDRYEGRAGNDRLTVRGLRVRAHHGVHPAERELGGVFVLDVVVELDTRRAAASDEVVDTVDYSALVSELAAATARDPVALLETLAERLASLCLGKPGVVAVEVAVHKPHAPLLVQVEDVSVWIRRTVTDTCER
ncbi:MAG: dihydroneopterin aldolase [Mycobacteriales bacterium]